jgi:hypothetical protein
MLKCTQTARCRGWWSYPVAARYRIYFCVRLSCCLSLCVPLDVDQVGPRSQHFAIHAQGEPPLPNTSYINAVQLSRADGSLAAWSLGRDGALVRTDITTGHTRRRMNSQLHHCIWNVSLSLEI